MSSREEGAVVNRVSWSATEVGREGGGVVINVPPRREERGTREEIPSPPPLPHLVCFILEWNRARGRLPGGGKKDARRESGGGEFERRNLVVERGMCA